MKIPQIENLGLFANLMKIPDSKKGGLRIDHGHVFGEIPELQISGSNS